MAKPKFKIKKDDTVKVIAGKSKGHVGRVVRVYRDEIDRKQRVVVEGANQVKRHVKPTGDRPGGIVTKEAALHVSNVVLWNADENRRVKVGYKVEDGKKIRIDRKTGASLDNA